LFPKDQNRGKIGGCGPTGSPAGMPLFIRIPPARLPERAAPGLRRVWCHDRRRPILPSGQHRPSCPFTGSPPHAPGCRGPGSAATAAPPGPRHGRRFAPSAGARATPGLRNPSGCSGLDVGGGLPAASRVPAWSSTRRSPARLPPPGAPSRKRTKSRVVARPAARIPGPRPARLIRTPPPTPVRASVSNRNLGG